MSRLISSWPVQLRDAATAGDPVHDDGADEIRPSPAEATRQARDADVELPLFDRTLGYGVWARMNSRGERILSPECGWLSL